MVLVGGLLGLVVYASAQQMEGLQFEYHLRKNFYEEERAYKNLVSLPSKKLQVSSIIWTWIVIKVQDPN